MSQSRASHHPTRNHPQGLKSTSYLKSKKTKKPPGGLQKLVWGPQGLLWSRATPVTRRFCQGGVGPALFCNVCDFGSYMGLPGAGAVPKHFGTVDGGGFVGWLFCCFFFQKNGALFFFMQKRCGNKLKLTGLGLGIV